jgi:hypothetical protein
VLSTCSVATALYVDDNLSYYTGGIYTASNPNREDSNHAVMAVGYDDTKASVPSSVSCYVCRANASHPSCAIHLMQLPYLPSGLAGTTGPEKMTVVSSRLYQVI